MAKITTEQREHLHRILDLVLDRNEEQDTFFEFFGHVNELEIRLCEGKWKWDSDVTYKKFSNYLDFNFEDEKILCLEDMIQKIHQRNLID